MLFICAQKKKLTFTVESDETLPLVLYGDDVRIRQIVTNLLTNAVKYTPQGSVHLKAAYECQSDDRMLLKISVQDTGIGIRKEDMGKLFESFQRLDEEQNRNIEGTGLGMNITMSLLKMMDGELKVESEYQKGSTFTVIIPQKIISREPAGSFRQMKEKNIRYDGSRQSSFTAPKGKVLVVDDNTMNLTVFQALLKRTKLQVVTAESGNQCLSYVQKQKFHIIFMDHMMPKMDGIETLHEIKKLAAFEDFPNKDTPVIALTANAVAGAKEMYLAQGFAEFLTKPINAELMEYTICKYLPAELMQTAKEAGSDQETANGAYETDSDLERGVSIRNGLKYSKGDMELYLELVRMFLKDQNKIKLLRQYLSVHNMKDYAILVHALKGNARTLGADALADLAYEHEMHSKAGQEDYITAHWAQLEQAWETARETFESIYKKYAAAPEETADLEERKPLELPQEKLDETAALIDDFKTDAAVEHLNP